MPTMRTTTNFLLAGLYLLTISSGIRSNSASSSSSSSVTPSFRSTIVTAKEDAVGAHQHHVITPRRLDDDFSWMSGYTLKYENCFAGSGLVTFLLCPHESNCESGCSGGGQYLVDFAFFLDAFTEAQMEAREYACEMIREACEEDGVDDDEECYGNAGYDYSYCYNNNNDGDGDDDDDFDLQEYLECQELEEGYYVGPYCSSDDAYSIYLGLFSDEDCTVRMTDTSSFYNMHGYELRYSTTPIIENACANCREHGMEQDQNGGDQEDDDDVLEQCEELYAEASKCEEELDADGNNYVDTSGCVAIKELEESEEALATNNGGGFSFLDGDFSWNGSHVVLLAYIVGIAACCFIPKCCEKRNGNASAKEKLIGEQ